MRGLYALYVCLDVASQGAEEEEVEKKEGEEGHKEEPEEDKEKEKEKAPEEGGEKTEQGEAAPPSEVKENTGVCQWLLNCRRTVSLTFWRARYINIAL